MLLQWGRFLTWKYVLLVAPKWLVLAYFWLMGPLYPDYWSTIRQQVPKYSFDNFLVHKDTMVLMDIIRLEQDSF